MKKFHISIFFFIITAAAYASPGILRERMYIATDKECYLSGENVWLSAFCFDLNTGAASNGSAVAYIELQNLSRSLVQAKIKLSLGRGSGHLALPLTLPTGIYRLTAYTRYMLSEDKEIFYARYITVYNPQTSLRSDNVIVAGEGTTDMTAPVRTLLSGKNPRLITLSTDRESYAPRTHFKMFIENHTGETVSTSVSVFAVDSLNHYCNPSITEYIPSIPCEGLKEVTGEYADYAGEVIYGHIVDQDNNRVANSGLFYANISIAGQDIQYYTAGVSENGDVRFFTSNLYGDGVLVSHVPSYSQTVYHLVLEPAYAQLPVNDLPVLTLDPAQKESLLKRSTGVQLHHAFRLDTLDKKERLSFNPLFQNTGITYKLDEYTRFPVMAEVMIEFIKEARFRTVDDKHVLQVRIKDAAGVPYYLQDPTPPLILLDGIPVPNHETIYKYDPNLIESITIYPHQYAFGSIYYSGIAFFKTYQGNFSNLNMDQSIRVQDFQGVQNVLLPGIVPQGNRLPDRRHTLYWNPRVDLQKDRFTTLEGFTSECKGTYCVVIEGMGLSGTPFRSECIFEVK
ncbi:MAG TPA: hypothetical protein PKM89_07185 [Bacteroidales bacterium]|nr:hypothetical protein [Bacteroidales bacterium]